MDFLDEDSDEESDTYKLFGGKEGIVFVIDATDQMFDPNRQQFSEAIQCVENVMKNKAISRPSDELALILFGTGSTANDHSFEHIFVVQRLQKTSADLVLALKDVIECDFGSKFGHNSRYSLADVFSTAISEFTKSKSRFQTKRVILLTCTSEPHSGNTAEDIHLRRLAINRAKDFKDHSIEVELIPMAPKGDKQFDFEAFYELLFPELKDDISTDLNNRDLVNRVFSKSFKQRMLASIPFRLGPWGPNRDQSKDVQMSVYVYSLFLEARKPTAVKINRKDFTELKTDTQRWTQDVGAIVKNEELTKKYEFGKSSIYLNSSDTKASKSFEEPTLALLGFKPKTALKTHLHIKPGHFIYPNESHIKGSTTLFNALLKKCIERNKVAICRLTLRRSAPPRLVALYPQIECKALDKFGGFHVVHLPFKDDIREPDIKGAEQLPLTQEALDTAKRIVDNLTFSYDPKNFPNPVLQTHWRAIEALALNYTQVEEYDDKQTQPDYRAIEQKAGYDLYSLHQLLPGSAVSTEKKVKVYDDLRGFAQNNTLGTLTVAEMKQFCHQNNIISGTRKAQLIEAIRLYYGIT